MKLIISVVTWNNEEQIEPLIKSLRSQNLQCQWEIVISDNHSNDRTCEIVKKYENVKLIENNENLGFGKAHNKVLKGFDADYYLILNPDCSFSDSNSIQKLIDFSETDSDFWVVGPKILNCDGTIQYSVRSYPNTFAAMVRSSAFEKFFVHNKQYRKYLMLDFDHNKVFYPDWLSGACILVKKQLVDEIGGFDERYFMYVEDMDLCRETKKKNKKVVYCPYSVVYHTIGTSSDKNKANCIKMHHKSMYAYYLKNTNSFGKYFLKFFVYIGIKLREKLILKSLK